MSAVNISGQSTQQSTCWACSSAPTSLDGNLYHTCLDGNIDVDVDVDALRLLLLRMVISIILLDTDEMLKHMMLFNKCTYKY